jgi:hypothetical protein
MKTWKEIAGCIIAFAAVCGLVLGAITYFAKAEELEEVREAVRLVDTRLEQKIVMDQYFDVQKRKWALEERNKNFPEVRLWPDERDRKQYKELDCQEQELRLRRDKLLKE